MVPLTYTLRSAIIVLCKPTHSEIMLVWHQSSTIITKFTVLSVPMTVKTFFCCHLCIETSFLGFPKFLGEEVQKEMHLFLIVSNFIEFCTAMRVSASRAITINTLNDLGHYTHRICTTLQSNSHEYKSHPFFESYNHHFPNDECLTFQQDQKPCQGLPKS